jgi:putative transposase
MWFCRNERQVGEGTLARHGMCPPTVVGMITILSTVVSVLGFRVHRRASMGREVPALRHQVGVLPRRRPGRLRLFFTDRLLWVWFYRVWPQVLNAMVMVKPATVIQWHRKGFQLHWRWRSWRLRRPKMHTEIRDLIRRIGQPSIGCAPHPRRTTQARD